jgi:hypothetical protein
VASISVIPSSAFVTDVHGPGVYRFDMSGSLQHIRDSLGRKDVPVALVR